MRAFVAIVRREILERRQILIAAALAALIPLVVPFLRTASAQDAADVRGWVAFFIAAAFSMGLVIALGASLFVPRIANRRIGFDLTRPLSTSAIWLGGVAASTALVLAAAAIIWLPTAIVGGRPVWNELVVNPLWRIVPPLLAVILVPVIFAVVHGLTLIFRSRSAWLALDAALLSACVLGVIAALSRLPERFAFFPRAYCILVVTGAAALAFLAAGEASVNRGRADLRASHRGFSTALWTIIVPVVVAAIAYAAWVMAAGPSSLVSSGEGFAVQPASNGSWVQLSGKARGADHRFLYDTASGRFVRAQTVDWRGPAFSRDGRRAAWIEGRDRGGPLPVRTLYLDRPDAKPVVTRLLMNTYPDLLVLSADGSRLATWERGVLSIHDLDTQRTLASAKVTAGDREGVSGVFLGRDALRLLRTADAAIDLVDFDATTRSLTPRGRIAASENIRYATVDTEGKRLVTVEGAGRKVRLYDAADAKLLALLGGEPIDSRWPAFLPDGRIVVSERTGTARRLRVFGHAGSEERTIPLPEVAVLAFGGETAPGLLCLGFGDASYRYTSWLVGLDDGSLRKIADDLRPLFLGREAPALGSDATKLFYGLQNSLVRLDPSTGERRTILGANP